MPVFGWDVSTSVLGACCLDDDGRLIAVKAFRMDRIDTGLHSKFSILADHIESFMFACSINGANLGASHHFVEQRLKNMVGRTSKDTLLSLAAINAVATHVIIELCGGDYTRVTHLYPVEVKKLVGLKVPKGADKKAAAIDFARARCPEFPYELNRKGVNPVKGTDDMADAYITALAGVQYLAAEQRKKAGPAEGIPRKTRVRKKEQP